MDSGRSPQPSNNAAVILFLIAGMVKERTRQDQPAPYGREITDQAVSDSLVKEGGVRNLLLELRRNGWVEEAEEQIGVRRVIRLEPSEKGWAYINDNSKEPPVPRRSYHAHSTAWMIRQTIGSKPSAILLLYKGQRLLVIRGKILKVGADTPVVLSDHAEGFDQNGDWVVIEYPDQVHLRDVPSSPQEQGSFVRGFAWDLTPQYSPNYQHRRVLLVIKKIGRGSGITSAEILAELADHRVTPGMLRYYLYGLKTRGLVRMEQFDEEGRRRTRPLYWLEQAGINLAATLSAEAQKQAHDLG